jgi:hypothetical protein
VPARDSPSGYDNEVNALLSLDGELESVLYMSVVGHPLRG